MEVSSVDLQAQVSCSSALERGIYHPLHLLNQRRDTQHRDMVVSVPGIGEERHKRHREMVVPSSPVFQSVERHTSLDDGVVVLFVSDFSFSVFFSFFGLGRSLPTLALIFLLRV